MSSSTVIEKQEIPSFRYKTVKKFTLLSAQRFCTVLVGTSLFR